MSNDNGSGIKLQETYQINNEHGLVTVQERECETCHDVWTSINIRTGSEKKRIDYNQGIKRAFQVGQHHFCCVDCAEKCPLPKVRERVMSFHGARGHRRSA